MPIIEEEKKAAFEQEMQQQGQDNFQIFFLDENGQRRPAVGRGQYFPVSYIVPMAGNGAALGYDLGSELRRSSGLRFARESRL